MSSSVVSPMALTTTTTSVAGLRASARCARATASELDRRGDARCHRTSAPRRSRRARPRGAEVARAQPQRLCPARAALGGGLHGVADGARDRRERSASTEGPAPARHAPDAPAAYGGLDERPHRRDQRGPRRLVPAVVHRLREARRSRAASARAPAGRSAARVEDRVAAAELRPATTWRASAVADAGAG